jgi:two-component system NtrC family sensor kinase
MGSYKSQIRLLLVDDEEDYRETIAKRLKVRGFIVFEASNGREAIDALSREPVDVVVLDVKMPVMDGMEALYHIKKDFPDIEVIMLTGHASPQDGVEGIKSGAFDYLCKPIEFEHLMSKIEQAYDKIIREKEKIREAEYKARLEQQMIATERLASVGIMAAGVAHEINNPLAIIKESAGWMKGLLDKPEFSGAPMKESFEMALEKISKSVERAKKVTHQLLGFVRKDDSIFKEVNLQELVAEVEDLVISQTTDKDIIIEKDIPAGPVMIWSDPYQLRQVLLNLASNAIQASPRGGRLTIRVLETEDEVIISVRDAGEGIPKENLERIFEPFFTTKTTGQGTGLGLFISRNIMEKLGGKIELESRLGSGSTFTVKLPRKAR